MSQPLCYADETATLYTDVVAIVRTEPWAQWVIDVNMRPPRCGSWGGRAAARRPPGRSPRLVAVTWHPGGIALDHIAEAATTGIAVRQDFRKLVGTDFRSEYPKVVMRALTFSASGGDSM